MPDMWMPGAEQQPQGGGVTLNRSLPARATWHITWDALTDGAQPAFDNVASYLKRMAYCPHLMWDPWTGRIVQFYPADVGARALNAWNEDGAVHVQIETFFSPGTVRDGKTYNTVADTPCKGLPEILAWLDSLGIPRQWPMGAPQWTGNSRDPGIWNTRGGHYGHCNVPDNTHTDPGPMPDIGAISGAAGTITPIASEEEELMAALDTIMARFDQVVAWEDAHFTLLRNQAETNRNLLAGFVRDTVASGQTLTADQIDAKLKDLEAATAAVQLVKGDKAPDVYVWDGGTGYRHIELAEFQALASTGATLKTVPQATLDAAVGK